MAAISDGPSPTPLRLTLDGRALAANWRWLDRMSGAAACGAAVKAEAYGIGAREATARLAAAGCRDFLVATWDEVTALGPLPEGARLSVLHGVRAGDIAAALASTARPVLNTAEQVARWKAAAPGRPCDVMVDTGINRLGLAPADALSGLLDGLTIDTLMSHLACADEDSPMNTAQQQAFAALAARLPAQRYSLANSAGICLGSDYHFGLVRPGMALYGGVPRAEAVGHIAQVARLEAEVLQVRTVAAGDSVGYGRTWRAERPTRVAILNIGYADGYPRALSNAGRAMAGDVACPVLGRVSMDLLAVGIGDADVGEGDWLAIDYDLPGVARAAGVSQYELLTGLGGRYQRRWI